VNDTPARRGRYRRSSEGPRPLHEGLEIALEGLGTPDAKVIGTVFTRWEEIAGTALAGHVRPLKLSAGVLSVAVDHSAWATQVKLLAPSLLNRVSEVTGQRPDRLEVSVRRT
jgi:predicted nucleic acid-binding Zn ribbon protein